MLAPQGPQSQTISKLKTVRELCKCEFGLAQNGAAEMVCCWSAFSAKRTSPDVRSTLCGSRLIQSGH